MVIEDENLKPNNMYTLQFFIRKAEAINPALWITGRYGYQDSHCFLGWCGVREGMGETLSTPEADFIYNLFREHGLSLIEVNDYQTSQFPQLHAKDRIIAALYWIRQQQAFEQAREIVNEVGEMV